MLRSIGLTALMVLVAGPALAHTDHGASGFLHPFLGPDHLLATIAAGAWAALLAVRRPAASWLVPLAFMTMMALGAAAGFAGIKVPFAEAGVLASVFMLGGLIVARVRMPLDIAMVVVGLFAVLHGYAHALEAPENDPGRYILGFLLATAVLHGVGVGLGSVAQRLVGDLGMRALGGLVFAGGALVLAAH